MAGNLRRMYIDSGGLKPGRRAVIQSPPLKGSVLMFGPNETVRVGMIGCGGNARGHARRLLGLDGVEIVGLCDPTQAAIAATRKVDERLTEVPAFAEYGDMLRDVQMDAVEISTPHTLHYEQIMAALDAGLHVLTEKPMVCTVEHAEAAVEKVKQTGLVMGVSYQRHGQAPYRYCREAISSGELGTCHFVSCWQSQNWYSSQVPRGTWRSQMKWAGGGQLNDSGSHLLDIVLWMTGLKPAEVFSYQDNMGSEVDVLSAIAVKFENGALCNFSVVGHAVNFHEEIALFCEEATLAIVGQEVWRWEGEAKQVVSGDDLGRTRDPDSNFIGALRGQEQIQASSEDGREVIRLSEAIWEAAATGQPATVKH